MGAVSLLALIACAQHDTHPPASNGDLDAGFPAHPPGGGSGGSSGASSSSGGGDGGTCTTVELGNAPVISQQTVAEAAPVPLGGVITDGTYTLTRHTIFTGPGGTTGPTGVTLQELQVFSATSITVVSQPTQPSALIGSKGTFVIGTITNDAGVTTNGVTMSFDFTCPSGVPPRTLPYTSTGTTLLEFRSASEVLAYALP